MENGGGEISPCDGNFRREREREKNRQREAFPPASHRDGISIARERARGRERPLARERLHGRERDARARKKGRGEKEERLGKNGITEKKKNRREIVREREDATD